MITWETPQILFDDLDREFHFDLDVCASHDNAKCNKYFTKDLHPLEIAWFGNCWMNPPYGKKIGLWIQKAWEEAQKGILIVCLLPASTDTKWWHEFIMKSYEIRFIKDRLYFSIGSKTGRSPFGSVIVIFKKGIHIPKIKSIGPYNNRIHADLAGLPVNA